MTTREADHDRGREDGAEPISPELVLVCPELARPERAFTRAEPSVLRPPQPAGFRASRGGGPARPPAGDRLARDVRQTLPAQVVLAAVAGAVLLSVLSWRAVVDFGTGERSPAPAEPALKVAVRSVASPDAPPAAPARNAVRPVTKTASARAPAPRARRSAARPASGSAPSHRRGAAPAVRTAAVRATPVTTRKRVSAADKASPPPSVRAPTGPLFAPDAGVHLVAPPRLSWDRVANVRGYRVRLYRGARLVLDAIAAQPRLTLATRWRFGGRQVVLSPATYRWYVWPLLRSGAHAAPVLKASSFVLVRPARPA